MKVLHVAIEVSCFVLRTSHFNYELEERQADLAAGGARSVARPADVVHDRRAARLALSAVGDGLAAGHAVSARTSDAGGHRRLGADTRAAAAGEGSAERRRRGRWGEQIEVSGARRQGGNRRAKAIRVQPEMGPSLGSPATA